MNGESLRYPRVDSNRTLIDPHSELTNGLSFYKTNVLSSGQTFPLIGSVEVQS